MKDKFVLKKETRYFMKAFYIIVVALYFVALMIVSCCADIFPDTTTGFYWFSEVMNCANKILFIGIFMSFACEWFV